MFRVGVDDATMDGNSDNTENYYSTIHMFLIFFGLIYIYIGTV